MGAVDHRRLLESIGVSPIATVISNPSCPDNPLQVVNPAFCALTGYAESEIVGRNCRFLAGAETDTRAIDIIRIGIGERRPVLVEILNYRKDGSAFRNGVMITPLFDDDGQLQYFLGSQVDLGPAEGLAKVRSAAAAKVAALPPRQREVLKGMELASSANYIALTCCALTSALSMASSALSPAFRSASA